MAYDLASAIERIEAAAVPDADGNVGVVEWEPGDTYPAPPMYMHIPAGGLLPSGLDDPPTRDGVSVRTLADGSRLIKDRHMTLAELRAVHASGLELVTPNEAAVLVMKKAM